MESALLGTTLLAAHARKRIQNTKHNPSTQACSGRRRRIGTLDSDRAERFRRRRARVVGEVVAEAVAATSRVRRRLLQCHTTTLRA